MLTVKILNITQIVEYFNVCFLGEHLNWSRMSAYCGLLISEKSLDDRIPLKMLFPVAFVSLRALSRAGS